MDRCSWQRETKGRVRSRAIRGKKKRERREKEWKKRLAGGGQSRLASRVRALRPASVATRMPRDTLASVVQARVPCRSCDIHLPIRVTGYTRSVVSLQLFENEKEREREEGGGRQLEYKNSRYEKWCIVDSLTNFPPLLFFCDRGSIN